MAKPFGKATNPSSPFGWLEMGRDRARRWSGRGLWPFAAERPVTAPASGYRKALFEPLEPRLLLAADPFTYAATAASELALRLDDTTNDFQIIDKANSDDILASKAASQTTTIQITGSTGADKFTIDFSTPFTNAVSFDGGDGDDTLEIIGVGGTTDWALTGSDAGTASGTGGLSASFSFVENLIGGADTDNFDLGVGDLTGSVDGGGGTTDTLTGGDVANSWTLTATDAGTVTGVGGTFSNIENLTGGTAADSFNLGLGDVTGSIDGAGGTDTLTGRNITNTWTLTATDAGTVTGVGGFFSNIENLTGGTAADSFNLGLGDVTGSIDGAGGTDSLTGRNITNTWTLTATDAGTVTSVGGFFSNIENLTGGTAADSFNLGLGDLTGSVDGGGGTDSLTGRNITNTWTLTATDAGTVTSVGGTFSNIENLTGGTAADSINLSIGSLSGGLAGGLGRDTLTYAARATSVTVNLGSNTATDVGGLVSGIEDLVGGANADVLTGDAADNRMTGGAGVDVITGGGGTNTLVEARDADFTLTAATLQIGAEGTDVLSGIGAVELTGGAGANILDTTAFSGDVTLAAGAGDDTIKVSAVGGPSVDGGADSDTLIVVGTGGADSFDISDSAVTLDGTDTIDLTGASIESLEVLGGAGGDTFNVTPSATLPIHIDGQGGADTLNIDAGGNDVVVRQGRVDVVGAEPVTYTNAATETVNLVNRGEIINALDRAVVEAGLAALVDLGEEIEDTDALAAVLPGLADNTVTQVGAGLPPVTGGDVTLGRAMGIGEVVTRLREQVSAFFDGDATPTLKELKAYLDGLTVTSIPADAPAEAGDLALGDLTISIGSVTETLIENENGAPVIGLAFTLVATRRTRFDLDYGADADSLGVVLDPEDARDLIELETELTVDLGIGLQGAGTDELFFELDGLTVDGSAQERDLSFDVDFGFLGGAVAPVENISVSGTGPFAISFENALGEQDVAELVVDDSTLTGGTATIATTTGGAAGIDEVQELTVTATGGTFTLAFGGQITGPIDHDADAEAIQAALAALTSINPDQISLEAETTIAFADPNGNGRLATSDLELSNATVNEGASAFSSQFGFTAFAGIDSSDPDAFEGLVFGIETDGVFTGMHRFSATSPVLKDFTAVLAGGVSGMLSDVADWLQRLADSALFDFDIPLAQQLLEDGADGLDISTLGNLYDFGGAFRDAVLERTLDGSAVIDATVPTAQTVTVVGSGGSYTLSFGGEKTERIAASATAGDLEAALLALSGIGSGDVSVTKLGNVYTVAFTGALSGNGTALAVDPADVTLVSGLRVPVGGGVNTVIPGFTNAQSLGAVLSAILSEVNGVPVSVTPFYDSAAQTLTYDINWTHVIAGIDLPVELGLDLGDLTDIATDSTLAVNGSAEFDVTFGIDLAARAAFTLAPPLPVSSGSGIEVPVDGVLDAPLTFELILNNDFDNPVQVTVPVDATNGSADDLVDDFQAAVNDAILSGAARALGFDYQNADDTLSQVLKAARPPSGFAPTEGLVEINGVPGHLFGLSVNQDTPVTIFLPEIFTSDNTTLDDLREDIEAALALRDAQFDGSSASVINVTNNSITDTQFAFFETGQSVVYRNGGGESIGGLVDGETYFVVKDAVDTIRLTTDRSFVFLDDPIVVDLTSTGGATVHALRDSSSLAGTVSVGIDGDKLTFSAPTADENVTFVRADDSFTVGDVAAQLSSDGTRVEFLAGSSRVTAVAAQLDGLADDGGVPSNGVLSADANFRLFVDDTPFDITVAAADTLDNETRLARLTGAALDPGVSLSEDAFFELAVTRVTATNPEQTTTATTNVLLPLRDGLDLGFLGNETGSGNVTATNALSVSDVALDEDVTFALTVGGGPTALVMITAAATDDNLTGSGPRLGFQDTATAAPTLTGLQVLETFTLGQDVTFNLTVGGTTKLVMVAAGAHGDLGGLISAIQTGLDAQFGAGTVTAGEDEGRLTLAAADGSTDLALEAVSERFDLLVDDINLALSLTLPQFGLPIVNASHDGQRITLSAAAGVSLAVTSPGRADGVVGVTALAAELNKALTAANLDADIEAVVDNGAIKLAAKAGTDIVTLSMTTEVTDATKRSELGFQDGQTDSRIDGLIADIQAALDAELPAQLQGKIKVETLTATGGNVVGDVRLGISTVEGSGISSLRLQADLTDPTVTELGFSSATDEATGGSVDPLEAARGTVDLLARGRSDVAFLADSHINNATVNISNANVSGTGRIGFLDVGFDGPVDINATVNIDIVDPDSGSGARVDIATLLDRLSESVEVTVTNTNASADFDLTPLSIDIPDALFAEVSANAGVWVGASTILGFDNTETPATQLAAARVPSSVAPDGDVRFALTVGDAETVTITVAAASMAGNATLSDLVQDIQDAVDAAGVTGVTVGAVDGKLTLDHADSPLAFADVETSIAVTAANLGGIQDFIALEFGNVVVGLTDVANYLDSLDSSFLTKALPIINASANDAIDYAAAFREKVEALEAAPAPTVGELKTRLTQSLGLDQLLASGAFGFADGQGPADILTGGAAPASFELAADVAFRLTVGADPAVVVTVEAADTDGNENIADLVADIQTALNATGLTGVTAGTNGAGNRLTLSHATLDLTVADNPATTAMVEISYDQINRALKIDLPFFTRNSSDAVIDIDFESLGVNLGDEFPSLTGMGDAATVNIQAAAMLDLQMGIDLAQPDGAKVTVEIANEDTADLTSFADLVALVQHRVDMAMEREPGYSAGDVTVTEGPGNTLVFTGENNVTVLGAAGVLSTLPSDGVLVSTDGVATTPFGSIIVPRGVAGSFVLAGQVLDETTGDPLVVSTSVAETVKGAAGANEVQTVTVTGIDGTFTLEFGTGERTITDAIGVGASVTTIKMALEELSDIDPGDVSVARNGNDIVVTFQGNLAGQDVGDLIAAGGDVLLGSAPIAFDADAADVEAALADIYGAGNVSVTVDPGSSETANIFNVAFANLPGTPELSVGNDSVIQGFAFSLELDGATGPSLQPFVFTGDDGTALTIELLAIGDDLVFDASVGQTMVFVDGGQVAINKGGISGSGIIDTDAAEFRVTLDGIGGGFSTRSLAETTTLINTSIVEVEGQADARLPLFDGRGGLPIVPAIPNMDIDVELGADSTSGLDSFFELPAFAFNEDPDPDAQELVTAAPELLGIIEYASPAFAFNEPSSVIAALLADPEILVDGLDSLLSSTQTSITDSVASAQLPLVGNGLTAVTDFIGGISEDLLTFLNFALRRSDPILTPQDLVRQVLFDVFGPGQDKVAKRNTVQTIELKTGLLGVPDRKSQLAIVDNGIEVQTIQRANSTSGQEANEIQRVSITTDEKLFGSFRLKVDGLETFPIHYVGADVINLPEGHPLYREFQAAQTVPNTKLSGQGIIDFDRQQASQAQAALEDLLGAGNVRVTKSGNAFDIEFVGTLAQTDVAKLGKNTAGLPGLFEKTVELGGDVTKQELQTALENLTNLGAGNVVVDVVGSKFVVNFVGGLTNLNVGTLSALVSGAPAIEIVKTSTGGVGTAAIPFELGSLNLERLGFANTQTPQKVLTASTEPSFSRLSGIGFGITVGNAAEKTVTVPTTRAIVAGDFDELVDRIQQGLDSAGVTGVTAGVNAAGDRLTLSHATDDLSIRAIEGTKFGALNILKKLDSSDATPLNRNDIGVEILFDGFKPVGVEFAMNLGQKDIFDVLLPSENRPNIDLSFDLGVDAIGLDVDAVLDLSLGWDFRFNFGISKDFGFYTHTEKSSKPEIQFTAGATLDLSKNEVQAITVLATKGSFTLEFDGAKTGGLPFDASVADVKTALEGLAGIEAGDVKVVRSAGDGFGVYTVTFQGKLAGKDVSTLVAAQSSGDPLMDGSLFLDPGQVFVENRSSVSPVSSITGNRLGAQAVGNLGPLTIKATDIIPGPGETDPRKQQTRLAATFSIDIKDPDRNILPIPVTPTGVLPEDVTLKIKVPVAQKDGTTKLETLTFTVEKGFTVTNNQLDSSGARKPIERLTEDIQFALDKYLDSLPQSNTDSFIGIKPGDLVVSYNPFTNGFQIKAADQGVKVSTLVDAVTPLVAVKTETQGSSSVGNIKSEVQLITFSAQAVASEGNPFEVRWKSPDGKDFNGGFAKITELSVDGIKEALFQHPRIDNGNISVEKVSTDDGTKQFRVSFKNSTTGLVNLGGRDVRELDIENPNAKGTAAERGDFEQQLIEFSDDAFKTAGDRFQIGFKKDATSPLEFADNFLTGLTTFQLSALIRDAVAKGLGVGSISPRAIDLQKRDDRSFVVVYRGDEFKDMDVQQIVVQRKDPLSPDPGARKIVSNSVPVEVDLDGDRLTFREIISPKFKLRDKIEGKVSIDARVNLALQLFIADENGKGARLFPKLGANFHLAHNFLDLSTAVDRGKFGFKPFPATENGQLDKDVDFKLTIKGGPNNKPETVKVKVAKTTTKDNDSVFDLVQDIQRRVNVALHGTSFSGAIQVKWDTEKRQVVFEKDPASAKRVTDISFKLDSGPQIAFTNVSLFVGSFLSDFIAPSLGEVLRFVAPFDFLIGADGLLTKRIPVLSDLAGHKVTLLTLARAFGQDGTANFLEALTGIRSLLDQIDEATGEANRPGQESVINFGDFELNDIRDKKSLKDVNLNDTTQKKEEGGAEQLKEGKAKRLTKDVSKGGGARGDFKFDIPFLTDPTQAFKMILGQFDAVTFFTLKLPEFFFEFEYRAKFNIYGPLFATLRGGVGATINLAFGYDGKGIAAFERSGNFGQVFDGFFISDRENPDGTGRDVPELKLTGQIAAGAELNAGVASAGVEAGIDITVKFDLNDPNQDGRVRFSEMAGNIEVNKNLGPLAVAAIFDIKGKTSWFLNAYVEALWGLWRKEFNLGRGTLFEFEANFVRKPLLASAVKDGGLLLHMGTNAAARLHGNVDDGDETFRVTQSGNKVTVSYNGFSEDHYGITKVIGFGGMGNDTIVATGLSSVVLEFDGGEGNDTITGGAAGDRLIGGEGADVIRGNGGADVIEGGIGNDRLFGGTGDDSLFGFEGDDELYGQAGSDNLIGGLDNDILAGGADGDRYVFLPEWGDDEINEVSSAGQAPTLGGGADPDILDFSLVPFALTHSITPYTKSGQEVGRLVTTNGAGSFVTHIGLEIEEIRGGRGFDLFDVRASGASGLQLDGQRGSDTYIVARSTLTPDPLRGPVFLQDTGAIYNFDRFIIEGTDNADEIGLTATKAVFLDTGTEIEYRPVDENGNPIDSGLELLEIAGLGGNDTFHVESTPPGTVVRLDGGAGDDVVNIGVSAQVGSAGTPGDLNGIDGNAEFSIPLVVKGASELKDENDNDISGNDTLNIFDSGDSSDNVGEMFKRSGSNMRLRGLGMAVDVEFSAFDHVNLTLGGGNDTFTVRSTPSANFTLNAGAGDDVINVREIQRGEDIVTRIFGDAGSDTINLGDKAPEPFAGIEAQINAQGALNKIRAPLIVQGGSANGADAATDVDVLNVDETGDGNNNGVLTADMLIGLAGTAFDGDKADITYRAFDELNIRLGNALGPNEETRSPAAFNDRFTIEDTHTGITTVDLFDGNDQVLVLGVSGHTFVNTGNGDNRVDVGDLADGTSLFEYIVEFTGKLAGTDIGALQVAAQLGGAVAVDTVRRSQAGPTVNEVQRFSVSRNPSRAALGFSVTDKDKATPGNRLIASRAVDGFDFAQATTFLLTVGDGPATQVTVGPTSGNATADDLAADVQAALDAAFGVNVVKAGTARDKLTLSSETETIAFADTFAVTLGGLTTADLAVGASAADVQAALELLPTIDAGDISVRRVGVVERIGGLLTVDGGRGEIAISTIEDGRNDANVDELHRVTMFGDAGTYALRIGGQETGPIAFDADAVAVRNAIVGLGIIAGVSGITTDDITVEQDERDFLISYVGDLSGIDIGDIEVITDNLSPDNAGRSAEAAVLLNGFDPSPVSEVQRIDVDAAAGTFRIGVVDESKLVIDQNTGIVDADSIEVAFTAALRLGASAKELQSELEALIGVGDVSVIKSLTSETYSVTYIGDEIGKDKFTLVADASKLAFDNRLVIADSGDATDNFGAMTGQTVTGLGMGRGNEVQTIEVVGTGGFFTLGFGGETTAGLGVDATADEVRDALEKLSSVGDGDVAVSRTGNVFTLVFQGGLGDTNLPPIVANGAGLTGAGAGATVVTRVQGISQALAPDLNEVQTVTLVGTGGTFKLGVNAETTEAIDFGADAAAVRAALEKLAAIAPGDVAVARAADTFTIVFQGAFNGSAAPRLTVQDNSLTNNAGGATGIEIASRTDGIDYYNIAALNLDLGSGDDDFTIGGTHRNYTQVEGFAGEDAIRIQAILGETAIDSGAGTDAISVGSADNKADNIVGPLSVAGGDLSARIATLNDGSRGQPFEGVGVPAKEIQTVTVDALSGDYRLTLLGETTGVISKTASAEDVRDALQALSVVDPGDVSVAATTSGDRTVYTISFQNGLDGRNIDQMTASPAIADTLTVIDSGDATSNTGTLTGTTLTGLGMGAGLTYTQVEALDIQLARGGNTFFVHDTHTDRTTVRGGFQVDAIDIEGISGETLILGGQSDDEIRVNPRLTFPTASNQIGAVLTLDGEDGSDTYTVNLAGDGDALINVFDSGGSLDADELRVNGTANDDRFLLRASNVGSEIAFVALINDDGDSIERINYDKTINGGLIVNAAEGNDSFTVDDNAVEMTLTGGIGDDTFQFGQMYNSPRDTGAGIAPEDVFATTETTRGFLSNGISETTTAFGGEGEDTFVVFRNLAVLSLSGGDGDDSGLPPLSGPRSKLEFGAV